MASLSCSCGKDEGAESASRSRSSQWRMEDRHRRDDPIGPLDWRRILCIRGAEPSIDQSRCGLEGPERPERPRRGVYVSYALPSGVGSVLSTSMTNTILMILLMSASYLIAQGLAVKMNFTPESDKYAEATKQYQQIWNAEGGKMTEAMEIVSGLRFSETDIPVIVFEGASSSGFGDRPMKLRASYPEEVKKATLIHELGHRLNSQLKNRPKDIDEHRVLFLYLYDVWTRLYGRSFADRMVEVEKKRKGIYDYETAWNWALSLSEEARATKFKEIVKNNSNQ